MNYLHTQIYFPVVETYVDNKTLLINWISPRIFYLKDS